MKRLMMIGLTVIISLIFQTGVFSEIIYMKGGGMLKGDITDKKKETLVVNVKYGAITLARKEIEDITADSDPNAVYDLARFYVDREQWDDAIEEFDNLLLLDPARKNEILDYVSDINFSRSPKQRQKQFESVTEAYQMIEEGKKLANFGKKQLKYNTRFRDYEWQQKIQRIGRKNIERGEALVRKGQAVIDSYHQQREEAIRKAQEKAQQEKQNKK